MAQAFVGEIRLFGGNYAPASWAPCDGRTLPIDQYPALYALIGTTYGGDGVNNFNLPDLRGRVPIHQGTGLSLTPRVIGQRGGAESHTLSVSELPSHTHPMQIASTPSTVTTSPNGTLLTLCNRNYSAPGTAPNVNLDASSVSMMGGNQPHENRMPTLAATYIICLSGIFPTRS